MESPRTFDVLIIGAGLAGLTAGLELQSRGHSVAVVERRSTWGGLCGTFRLDGYEFVIACNDFGQGLVRAFAELGVPVRFEQKRTRVVHGDLTFDLPLDARSAARILRFAPDLGRFLLGLRRRRRGAGAEPTLGPLAERAGRSPAAVDLLELPAYLMGVHPQDFRAEALLWDSTFGYGYSRPAAPVGGPQVLADALAMKLRERGDLLLSTEVLGVERRGGCSVAMTTAGPIAARVVLFADGRAAPREGDKLGLPLSALCLAVAKDLPYPDGIHTLVHYPPGISRWFGAIDAGLPASDFGFHLFRSDLPEQPDHYTMNAFFYLPRGDEDPSGKTVRRVEEYILANAERMLPGLRRALRYRRFISPRAFTALHGLSSRVTPVILPPGARPAPIHDPEEDTYFAGGAAFPPGDHAGAAVLSARLAAGMIADRLARTAA